MTVVVPISPDWTVEVPQAVREALGVQVGDQLLWRISSNGVVLLDKWDGHESP